jgi:hypothetical protein
MKTVPATRQVKMAISWHFRQGGNAGDLPQHLRGVDPAVIKECQAFASRKRTEKQKRWDEAAAREKQPPPDPILDPLRLADKNSGAYD